MSDNDDTKPVLLVKKADSKKGSLWNKLTNRRIIKQHGGFDIPENDLHAIPKYQSPVEGRAVSSEETNGVLSDIEKEIKELKEKENRQPLPQPAPAQNHQRFYEGPVQEDDDELY